MSDDKIECCVECRVESREYFAVVYLYTIQHVFVWYVKTMTSEAPRDQM